MPIAGVVTPTGQHQSRVGWVRLLLHPLWPSDVGFGDRL